MESSSSHTHTHFVIAKSWAIQPQTLHLWQSLLSQLIVTKFRVKKLIQSFARPPCLFFFFHGFFDKIHYKYKNYFKKNPTTDLLILWQRSKNKGREKNNYKRLILSLILPNRGKYFLSHQNPGVLELKGCLLMVRPASCRPPKRLYCGRNSNSIYKSQIIHKGSFRVDSPDCFVFHLNWGKKKKYGLTFQLLTTHIYYISLVWLK